jgi:hypothetical protein
LDRIATTGSNLAAEYAGMMPASMPMIMQMLIARERIPAEIKTGKLKRLLSIMVKI